MQWVIGKVLLDFCVAQWPPSPVPLAPIPPIPPMPTISPMPLVPPTPCLHVHLFRKLGVQRRWSSFLLQSLFLPQPGETRKEWLEINILVLFNLSRCWGDPCWGARTSSSTSGARNPNQIYRSRFITYVVSYTKIYIQSFYYSRYFASLRSPSQLPEL